MTIIDNLPHYYRQRHLRMKLKGMTSNCQQHEGHITFCNNEPSVIFYVSVLGETVRNYVHEILRLPETNECLLSLMTVTMPLCVLKALSCPIFMG